MASCRSCGMPVPDGQRDLCSMCMGDIGWGRDGYYQDWAECQEQKWREEQAVTEAQQQAEQEAEHGDADAA